MTTSPETSSEASLSFVELPEHLVADCPLNPAGVVEYGSYMGVDWVIAKSPIVGLNGYIRIPEGHPWQGQGYEQISPASEGMFGGLTYSSGNGRWFGFDTAHANDNWPSEYHWRGGWEPLVYPARMWSLELVRESVMALAIDAYQAA